MLVDMVQLVAPPGWPRAVRPPGAPGWEHSAVSWLLDICPPEYRSYPVLRRHAVVLARFAVLHVEACQAAVNRGLSEARGGLRDVADRTPSRRRSRPGSRVGAADRRSAGRSGWSRRRCGGSGSSPACDRAGAGSDRVAAMIRISVALLVDARGWVLLQERDEHAPIDPGQVGHGRRARRGRRGLRAGGLPRARGGDRHPAPARRPDAVARRPEPVDARPEPRHYTVWIGRTRATDADIVLGEGRQIVFVHPDDVAELDLADSCAHYLPSFLASQEYAALAG